MLDEESDKDLLETLEADNKNIKEDLKSLSIYLLFNKPYDKNNCIVEIHPGAGVKITVSLKYIQEQEELSHVTGLICFIECIQGTVRKRTLR